MREPERERKSLSRLRLFVTLGTIDPRDIVHGILQARILECILKGIPSAGDLPDPRTEPRSATLQADSLRAEPKGSPRMVFGSCALGPVLTAACRGIRPGVPRFLLLHRAPLCTPQLVLSAPRSPRHFLSSQGTLGARPAPCGGTWASPGHGMQRVGRGGFVSVCPCTSVLFQAGQAAPHGH